MTKAVQLYKLLFTIIFTLYLYLGKGIAYGYFAEILLVFGLILLFKQRKDIDIINNKSSKLLYLFLFLNLIFILRGFFNFPIIDTIRDGFIFNYIYFSFILLLFLKDLPPFFRTILSIYKYYPAVIFFLYFISLNKFVGSLSLFGDIHLLFFKFGDISVNLFAAFVFQISGLNKYRKPYDLLNLLIILLMFSLASSYSRGGMLSFLLGCIIYYRYLKDVNIKQQLKQNLKFLPILLLISFLFLSVFKVDTNFQGRTVGVDQVANNFTSIFSTSEEGGLNDNKIWRILWWGQIIDYTFNGPYFIAGKGLGINLAEDDQIPTTDLEGELRSPHNFNLSILARYGVFVFFLWLYWIYVQFRRLSNKNLSNLQLVLICLQIVFLFNASFDVFLEGPMGAFPFWLFVGIDLMYDYFKLYNSQSEEIIFTN